MQQESCNFFKNPPLIAAEMKRGDKAVAFRKGADTQPARPTQRRPRRGCLEICHLPAPETTSQAAFRSVASAFAWARCFWLAGNRFIPCLSRIRCTDDTAAARSSIAARREVPGANRRHATPAASVHGDRRLHPHSRPEGLRCVQSAHRHPVHRRGAPPLAVPGSRRPD